MTRADGAPVGTIQDGDSVIFFNFRADRARQITSSLAVPGFDDFSTPNRPHTHFVCFAVYDKTYPLPVAFPPELPRNILADVFALNDIENFRLAETEKYAHVTYFFNGGTEREFPREKRLLVPSPKVATYDLAPEMSAFKITDKFLRALDERETDVFVVNFANPDMVGHTGKLDKTIEACQYVDTCLGWITKAMKSAKGTVLITADHGNAELMVDPKTGEPHTAHTTNPVPFLLIDEGSLGAKLSGDGALEDVAPTMLGLLGIEQPSEMTGKDLRDE
jgi:2,3-bisphosphoglycerate-independent phosphoglycerate mutase